MKAVARQLVWRDVMAYLARRRDLGQQGAEHAADLLLSAGDAVVSV